MVSLAVAFFFIALFYSMVGFAGGSSYIALLSMWGVSYMQLPLVALCCNLIVAGGGCYRFWRLGFYANRLWVPFVVSSVPTAVMGGVYPVREQVFYTLLATTLVLSGSRMSFMRESPADEVRAPTFLQATLVGAVLGLLSGVVGIGGGIFLSPLLINAGWARGKNAAATASAFILLNSVAGIVGQCSKQGAIFSLVNFSPLLFAAFSGGQIGSRLGTHTRVSHAAVQRATGVLILLVGLKLFWQWR